MKAKTTSRIMDVLVRIAFIYGAICIIIGKMNQDQLHFLYGIKIVGMAIAYTLGTTLANEVRDEQENELSYDKLIKGLKK